MNEAKATMQRAVRAFNRVMAPICERQSKAAHMDAGFDGGEWSSGWHAAQMEAEELAVARRVGARFGVKGRKLLTASWMDGMEQQYRMTQCWQK